MELTKSAANIDENIDFKQISLDIRKGAYKCIGIGSGRIVFDLGNGYVVKVARNVKGTAQNKSEHKIALTSTSNLLARIPCVSEGYTLLIMDKADKIKNISYVWKYFNVKNNQELYQLKELQDISLRHSLLLSDLGRSANWGQLNGKPVIVDYGFTKEVRRRFYLPPFCRF